MSIGRSVDELDEGSRESMSSKHHMRDGWLMKFVCEMRDEVWNWKRREETK